MDNSTFTRILKEDDALQEKLAQAIQRIKRGRSEEDALEAFISFAQEKGYPFTNAISYKPM